MEVQEGRGEKGEGLDPVACTNFRIFQMLSIL